MQPLESFNKMSVPRVKAENGSFDFLSVSIAQISYQSLDGEKQTAACSLVPLWVLRDQATQIDLLEALIVRAAFISAPLAPLNFVPVALKQRAWIRADAHR